MPLLLLLAILGLLASAVVHFSTFFTDRLAMESGTWLLHLGVFVVMVPAIVAQGRARAAAKAREGVETGASGAAPAGRAKKKGKGDLSEIAPFAPRWMTVLAGACFAYALVNFAVFLFLVREGAPRVRDGQYLLMQNSRVVRPLSEAEFHSRNRYVTRGFSGHWMLFYSGAMATLYSGLRQRRAERATMPLPPPLTAGQASGASSYVLHPRPWLSPWGHHSLRMGMTLAGFMGGPASIALLLQWVRGPDAGHLHPLVGCAMGVPLFGSAILGAILPAHLFGRHVPARCPRCSGRAYFRSMPARGYQCADCGHAHVLEG